MSQQHNLIEIFQAITTKKISGTLVVENPRKTTKLYFSQGNLSKITHSHKEDFQFTDFLLKSGKVSAQAIQKVMEHSEETFSLEEFISSLEREHILSREEIQKLFREKISSNLYDLFFQKESTYEFKKDVDETAKNHIAVSDFDIVEFLGELLSQMGEWESIQQNIPSTRTVFVKTEKFDEALPFIPLPNRVREESVLVNGKNSVEEIISFSPLGRFEILHLLSELSKEGGIRPLEGTEKKASGPNIYKGTGEIYDPFKTEPSASRDTLLADLLGPSKAEPEPQSPIPTETPGPSPDSQKTMSLQDRLQMARTYIELEKTKEAEEELTKIAYEASEAGQQKETQQAYESLLKIKPANKAVMFQLYKIYHLNGDARSKDLGLDLGYVLIREGDLERAYKILNQVWEKHPQDVEINEALAEVANKTGKVEAAKKCYEFLIVKTSDEDQRNEYKQILFSLDPARAYQTDEIDAMAILYQDSLAGGPGIATDPGSFASHQLVVAPSKQKSSLKVYIGVFVVFLLLIGGDGIYELMARLQIGKLNRKWNGRSELLFLEAKKISFQDEPDLKRLREIQKEYAKIAAIYQAYLKSYNWSLMNTQALRQEQKHRQQLSQITKTLENLKRVKEEEEKDIKKAFYRYMHQGEKLERAGEFNKAIPFYFQVAKKFPQFKKKITLPLSITSLPEGASLSLNGKELGNTPFKGRVPLPKDQEWHLTVKKDGFWSLDKKVTVFQHLFYNFNLIKNTLWHKQIKGCAGQSPVLQGQRIFLLGKDGSLYSLAKETGNLQGKYPLGFWGDVFSRALSGDEELYIGNPEGKVYRFREGALKVIHQVQEPIFGAFLRFSDGNLLFLTRGGYLYGINRDGERYLKYEIKGVPLPNLLEVENRIYLGTTGGEIMALNREALSKINSNPLIWKLNLEEKGSLRHGLFGLKGQSTTLVLLCLTRGVLVAFNPQKQKEEWKVTFKGQILYSPLVLSSSNSSEVYVHTTDGMLYALRGESGATLWEKNLPLPATTAVRGGEKNLYLAFSSKEGGADFSLSRLLAFDRKTGKEVWSYEILGKILAPPTCSEGKVYLSTTEGYLYCIEDK